MNRSRVFGTALFFGLLSFVFQFWPERPAEAQPAPVVVTTPAPPPPEPEPTWTEHVIQKGDTLGAIVAKYGISAHGIRDAALEHYDLANIRAGRSLHLEFKPGEELPVTLKYSLDEDRELVLTRQEQSWTAVMVERNYQRHPATRTLVVQSTLWQAGMDADLRAADIATLARIFEYDVDFNTEIRAGATAEIISDELWSDGEFVKLGEPYVVRLTNRGQPMVAIRFEDGDGNVEYYDENGTGRRRALLRSPLEFSRVTSGFNTKRFHPILKKARPHYGTDFGAPTGTPVRAVGSGTVVSAGVNGGHGNFVKLDHPGPHDSSYSHLNRVKVKKGQRVEQGQIIGTVGSTGLATGPHLHYQLWEQGRYVDPMKVDLPRTRSVPNHSQSEFEGLRDTWIAWLDASSAPIAQVTTEP
ncbi:MAG: peptidoglycan DD-metalloendopeptidase family protein [Myxococcota bacterium]|jgi:murein DD-endopeptidase MepM/ murein hydrolase activator NlpD|nr:peptidoglycan DD-metalloendopeptidase family protein [Myxococcota bacterium]